MKIGILGAMPEEIAFLGSRMGLERQTRMAQRDFLEGTWEGASVVLAYSRIGKVSAALTTALLIGTFRATHVILTGVAGALDRALRVGDVVIADRLMQHDLDASPLFPRYEIPLLGRSTFPCDLADSALTAAHAYIAEDFRRDVPPERAAAFGMSRPNVRRGLIVSGDQFLDDPAEGARIRGDLPEALCVEMEGAAVAQVCYEMGNVPCAVIRVISDDAGHSAAVDFTRFVRDVAEFLTGGIAARLVQSLHEEASRQDV